VWPDAAVGFIAKVSDLGLATGTHGSTMRTTKSKTGAATLAYKAPECFDDAEFTTASEVYAFGIIAWEVLTAEVPWKGYSEAKLTKAITKEERPPLSDALKAVPSGQMVERCWAEEPTKRLTFAQLARALGSAAQMTTGAGADDVLCPPKTWTAVSDPQLVELVPVHASAERREVEAAFQRTLGGRGISILNVKRVQNVELWNLYAVKLKTILDREGASPDRARARYERRWLFHGTDEATVPKIAQQGFNRSYCGKNATAYGKGVYFARDSSYSTSTRYSQPNKDGVQHMFLCRVVVGEYCKGVSNAIAPPPRSGSVLFDTTVGLLGSDTLTDPSIYVTYHDAQAFPEYLVYFKQ